MDFLIRFFMLKYYLNNYTETIVLYCLNRATNVSNFAFSCTFLGDIIQILALNVAFFVFARYACALLKGTRCRNLFYRDMRMNIAGVAIKKR